MESRYRPFPTHPPSFPMIHMYRRVCLYVIHGHFFSLYYHSLPSGPAGPNSQIRTVPARSSIRNRKIAFKMASIVENLPPLLLKLHRKKERTQTHTHHLRGEWFIADEFPSDGGIITFPLPIPQHTHTHTHSRPRVSVCAIDGEITSTFGVRARIL